ncbi:MAG: hypothetical protein M1821_008113 [Bathelium mastoideum]|nr:MAG: hypothetical protein M1821_008113 [Bathelium mastoideum]KAI9693156.1 MAG: hypothetical protein M1822_005152 [Bathelium mastoideum]
MWLNRAHARRTPSSTSPPPPPRDRPSSPATASPRRSNHLTPSLPHRPGLPSRASSLSLLSDVSSETPSATKRVPNGSSLKHELSTSPVANVPDPLQVLEGVIGSPLKSDANGESEERGRTANKVSSERVQDIEFGGLSLREFVATGRATRPSRPRTSTEAYVDSAHTIAGFEKERDNFEELHRSILACDDVLKSVETYLMSFQKDLGTVSAEIETLQSRSMVLNTKMENRKRVEKILGPAAEEITLSPVMVKKIMEGPIDDAWVKALEEIERRSRAIDGKTKDGNKVRAAADLRPLLDNLTNKAVERIRDYLVAQIKALRSPNMNAQIIQQQVLLKHKDVYPFLLRRQPQLAEDISQAYINTMRWYYLNNFTRYRTALDKLKVQLVSAQEMIGNDSELGKRSNLAANSRIASATFDALCLGRRMDVIKTQSQTALPSHVAEEDQSSHFLEVAFRSFNLALIDNASAEFSFLAEFFAKQGFHAVSRKFTAVFSPTFELGQTVTKQLISDPNTDALGVLICVRLNQAFAFELQRRKVPAVEAYINGTNMLLWPRFQQIMDMHCESIRRVTSSLSGRSASALTLTSSNAQSGASTAPHPLTQKFANFVQAILALSSEAGDDEPVSNSLARLRTDFENFLAKMSKSVADPRKRERFLGNNYSLVLTIIGDTAGKLADEIREHFEEMKETYNEGR